MLKILLFVVIIATVQCWGFGDVLNEDPANNQAIYQRHRRTFAHPWLQLIPKLQPSGQSSSQNFKTENRPQSNKESDDLLEKISAVEMMLQETKQQLQKAARGTKTKKRKQVD